MICAEFLLTTLVVVLVPGTGVIYTLSNGLFKGRRASLAAAAGCTAGILPHLTASILGLSAILHMSALVFQTIKFAGVFYLLYLAWSMWKNSGDLKLDSAAKKGTDFQIARKAVLINLLNPKLTLFFFTFLPQFIPQNTPSPTMQLMGLSAIFMAMTFIIFAAYGLCAHSFRKLITNSPKRIRIMQRGFAATFALLGLKLATADR